MTNEELIARLRNHSTDVWHYAAADRISTLIEERDAAIARADRLEAALRRIRDIAEISDNGKFYAATADLALKGEHQ